MEYRIYHLLYDLGILPLQEAVVSAETPDKAGELLKNYLSRDVLGMSVDDLFIVREVSDLEVLADKESVLSPRLTEMMSALLMNASNIGMRMSKDFS